MAGKFVLCIFVMTLALFFLVSSSHLHNHNTRFESVLHETQAIPPPKDTFQMIAEKSSKENEEMEPGDGEFVLRRMDFEVTRDYPGSGANNRHTPNPLVKD